MNLSRVYFISGRSGSGKTYQSLWFSTYGKTLYVDLHPKNETTVKIFGENINNEIEYYGINIKEDKENYTSVRDKLLYIDTSVKVVIIDEVSLIRYSLDQYHTIDNDDSNRWQHWREIKQDVGKIINPLINRARKNEITLILCGQVDYKNERWVSVDPEWLKHAADTVISFSIKNYDTNEYMYTVQRSPYGSAQFTLPPNVPLSELFVNNNWLNHVFSGSMLTGLYNGLEAYLTKLLSNTGNNDNAFNTSAQIPSLSRRSAPVPMKTAPILNKRRSGKSAIKTTISEYESESDTGDT